MKGTESAGDIITGHISYCFVISTCSNSDNFWPALKVSLVKSESPIKVVGYWGCNFCDIGISTVIVLVDAV